MFVIFIVSAVGIFVTALGLAMIYGKAKSPEPGTKVNESVERAVARSMKSTGKALLVTGLIILAGDVAWYQLGYMSADRVAARSAQDMKAAANMNEIKLQRLVREFVLARLKDPDSAQFRNQSGQCGEVNAKNAMGGYVGYRRFMAGSEDLVVVEGDVPAPTFNEAWAKTCL